MYMGQKRTGLGEWDFSTIISDFAKAYTGVTQAQAAADIAKAQARQQAVAAQSALALRYNPTYSTGSSTGMSPIILMAGVGLLAYMMLRN